MKARLDVRRGKWKRGKTEKRDFLTRKIKQCVVLSRARDERGRSERRVLHA